MKLPIGEIGGAGAGAGGGFLKEGQRDDRLPTLNICRNYGNHSDGAGQKVVGT